MNQNTEIKSLKKLSLFAITWPLFIEFSLHILMGSADTFMLSRISDDVAAAVGVANQIVYISIILFGFVATGTSVVVAQYVGANKLREVSQISAVSITLNLLFGLFISIMLLLFHKSFLRLLNLPTDLFDFASTYLMIVGGGLFFEAVLLTISAVVRSNGFTRDAMFVTMGINVLNVIGNYLFIYGELGFPQWGLTGVAISTVVSRAVGVFLIFVILYKRLEFRILLQDYVKLKKEYVRNILRIGVPAAGEHLSWQGSQLLIIVFIGMLGKEALATHVYTFNIIMYIMLFGISIGHGTEIMVGQLVGARKIKEAYTQLLKSLKLGLLITVGVVLTFSVFRESLLGIFTDDPSIIQVGASILLFGIILEPGRTFNVVIINSLRATGDAQFPVFIGILSMWGISVPLSYFLGIYSGLGLLGIYMAFAVDEWVRGILMYFRWKSRAWETKALISSDQNEIEINVK
jgi:putative MATE family efflux protein